MLSTWLGSDKHKSLVRLDQGSTRFGFPDLPKRETDVLLIQPSRLFRFY